MQTAEEGRGLSIPLAGLVLLYLFDVLSLLSAPYWIFSACI